jgi:hypothetical protein
MTSKNKIYVGKVSGRIIEKHEETIEFPTLDMIYEMISNSNLSRLFASEQHFIKYLKDTVEGAYPLEFKAQAMEEIFDAIRNEIFDYDEEEQMDDIMSDIEFADILMKNFTRLYEISYPVTKISKKK